MNEMKPEDVMRALEHCANYKSQEVSCIGCPLYGKCDVNILEGLALALLREKDAEIERLKAEVNRLDALSDEMGGDIDCKLKYIYELEDKLKAEKADVMYFKDQIRADAITEFAEKIVKAIHPEYPISVCQVYRIAKEMKGDQRE